MATEVLKRVTMPESHEKVLEDWQVLLVNNHRDLFDEDWRLERQGMACSHSFVFISVVFLDSELRCSPHGNVDLHFVTSLHWPTLTWKDPELLQLLEKFATGRCAEYLIGSRQ